MIERCILPIRRIMARFALSPILSIMFIVFAMAGITILRCAFEDIIRMAFFTGGFSVFTLEFERRKVVIEIGG